MGFERHTIFCGSIFTVLAHVLAESPKSLAICYCTTAQGSRFGGLEVDKSSETKIISELEARKEAQQV